MPRPRSDSLETALESLRQVDKALELGRGSPLDMSARVKGLETARERLLEAIDALCQNRARSREPQD